MDSPAANAAFKKQLDVKFPLLSDMNKKMLKDYGILKGYDVKGDSYQWAQRANIVIDKEGIVRYQHVMQSNSHMLDPEEILAVVTQTVKGQ